MMQSRRPPAVEAPHAVDVVHLAHTYSRSRGSRRPSSHAASLSESQAPVRALDDVSFSVRPGEMFGLLGPNASGKSTLFRILSTLMKPGSGDVRIFGNPLLSSLRETRRSIGVVFQKPSLDLKLTANENLSCQGSLYGMHGLSLASRIGEVLERVGIAGRRSEPVERLSGGMQRRVELAKAILHAPRLLVLDEPSTGLDPGARKEFDSYLKELCVSDGVTALLTTHILEEADMCDRLGIMDRGRLVAMGSPSELKDEIGAGVVSVTSADPDEVAAQIRALFGGNPRVVGTTVRVERADGHEFIPELIRTLGGRIGSVTYSRPTLEDAFIRKTGRVFLDSSRGEGTDA